MPILYVITKDFPHYVSGCKGLMKGCNPRTSEESLCQIMALNHEVV